ncbi:unnamed protein product [Staurois parvus]|uniref:Uncharacterized protein n=1 Tax=Staurois parvus TaxID=386267 RepID=A0ABN9AIJ5_9NEOB|nr:unnamed protein product [Staurois parvus]
MIAARSLREAGAPPRETIFSASPKPELHRERAERYMLEWKEDSRGVIAGRIPGTTNHRSAKS